MGSRDIRKKETKKPRKDHKKMPQVDIITPSPAVEVVNKHKKKVQEEG